MQYFGNDELTVDEIQLLGDCFYTQGQKGELGIKLVESVECFMKNNSSEWGSHLQNFIKLEANLNSLCKKLLAVTNRDLLYDFYLTIWELKEETEYVSKWVEWKQSGKGEFQSPEIVPRRKGILYEFQDIIHSD